MSKPGKDATPISWMTLATGTDVLATDGSRVANVAQVIADAERDIFTGITIRSGLFDTERFVSADLVGEITTDAVTLKLGPGEIEGLEPYDR